MVRETATLSEREAYERGFIGDPEPGMSTDSAGSDLDGFVLETHYAKDGSIKTVYEDPPQIDVNSVKASVSWSTSGGNVTASHRQAHWGWYSPSGWSRNSHWWTSSHNSGFAWTSVYGKYKNPIFCLTVDTWTDYDTTNFRGNGNGSSSWWWSSDKWGGCNWLLNHEETIDPN